MALPARLAWLLYCLLLLVGFASTAALAHEDHEESKSHEEMHGHMDMHHAAAPKPTASLIPNKEEDSYWTYDGGKFFLYSHIGIMIVDWVFVLPISVMFSVAKSNLHMPTQALFLILHGLGVLCSMAYNSQTPDLYPKNAHHRMSWIATFVLAGQAVIGIVFLSGRSNSKKQLGGSAAEMSAFIPAGFQPIPQRGSPVQRSSWMSDSAHGGSERSSNSSSHGTREHSMEQRREYFPEIPLYDGGDDEYEDSIRDKQLQMQQSAFLSKIVGRFTPKNQISARAVRTASFIYSLVQRIMIIWGFIILLTGLVTLTGAFMGNKVFNGLAHLIKGGIFFLYGILTLGRYLGAFADIGWAWNLRPSDSMINKWLAHVPSSEMTESFVIFLYGITNVWLEHLAGWGQEWSPMDLEHVSISFWFMGGGLCGMLLESRKLKEPDKVLQSSLSASNPQFSVSIAEHTEPSTVRSPNFNPAPSLVFFMLGILMGGHHQHAHLGAVIHKQWGILLSGFSAMRLGTYALLYLAPPSSYLPTRPFTELLGSFCLMSGGLIFMMSNASTVNYLLALDIDGMFVFTIMISLAALIMSWVIILLALKGWAARREILRYAGRSVSHCSVEV